MSALNAPNGNNVHAPLRGGAEIENSDHARFFGQAPCIDQG